MLLFHWKIKTSLKVKSASKGLSHLNILHRVFLFVPLFYATKVLRLNQRFFPITDLSAECTQQNLTGQPCTQAMEKFTFKTGICEATKRILFDSGKK